MFFITNETIYKSEKIGNFESVFSAVISPVHSAVKVAKMQKWSEWWKAAVAAQSLLKNLQRPTKKLHLLSVKNAEITCLRYVHNKKTALN